MILKSKRNAWTICCTFLFVRYHIMHAHKLECMKANKFDSNKMEKYGKRSEARTKIYNNIYHFIITNVTPSCHVYAIHSCKAYDMSERANERRAQRVFYIYIYIWILSVHTKHPCRYSPPHDVNSLKIYSGMHSYDDRHEMCVSWVFFKFRVDSSLFLVSWIAAGILIRFPYLFRTRGPRITRFACV